MGTGLAESGRRGTSRAFIPAARDSAARAFHRLPRSLPSLWIMGADRGNSAERGGFARVKLLASFGGANKPRFADPLLSSTNSEFSLKE